MVITRLQVYEGKEKQFAEMLQERMNTVPVRKWRSALHGMSPSLCA